MRPAIELVDDAVGTDKFVVLAELIDHLYAQMRIASGEIAIEDEIATLDLEELASQYKVSQETLRRQLCSVLGPKAVFKLGKTWVVRKRKFLQYLEQREVDETSQVTG